MRQVVVVGDVGRDVLVRQDHAVGPGEETRGQVSITPGGAGANTASWLVRAGSDVTLVARVGSDDAGREALRVLAESGVRCAFAVDPALPTCVVVVLVTPDGERTMISDRGASGALDPADVVLPSGARGHVHVSGYVLLDAGSRPAGLYALATARAAGWTTSVDPQAARHVAEAGPGAFLEWCAGVDLLLPSETELDVLGGAEPVLEVVGAVAVTHGARGATWFAADGSVFVPTQAQARVDSTGAGDAFNAGLIAARLAGSDPEAALAAGVRLGTAAASTLGARPGPQ